MEEVIHARGHPSVRATHASTLEVTTEDFLTEAGDCIIGIEADRSPSAFSTDFIDACRDPSATIKATLEVDGMTERLTGSGDPGLTFADDTAAVIRSSKYVDDRTVMVGADMVANDLDRALVRELADGATLVVTLSVHT